MISSLELENLEEKCEEMDGREVNERKWRGSKDESSSEDEVGNDSFLLTNWEACIPLMGRRKVFGWN